MCESVFVNRRLTSGREAQSTPRKPGTCENTLLRVAGVTGRVSTRSKTMPVKMVTINETKNRRGKLRQRASCSTGRSMYCLWHGSKILLQVLVVDVGVALGQLVDVTVSR